MKKVSYLYDYILILLLGLGLMFGLIANFSADIKDTIFLTINLLALIPVVVSTINAIKSKTITVDLLATIALLLSIANKELYSTLFINLMLTTARIVDGYTQRRTENSIKNLLKLKPVTVRVKRGNSILQIPAEQVLQGDIVVVNLGERIPVDGLILSGSASIDQSTLTGESLPIEKNKGEDVLSSTLIVDGNLEIKATRVGKNTTLEKIIKLVRDSEENKSGITTIADKFAQYYILIVLIAAIVIYAFTNNLNLVLSVVLVVCADDIAIAIPLAFIGGIRAASRMGIIIKGGKYLEAMSKLDVLVLDKTGTLTKGTLEVEDVKDFSDNEDHNKILFSITNSSTHPVTKAINKYLKNESLEIVNLKLTEVKGKGITAEFENNKFYLGKKDFIVENNIPINKDQLDFAEQGLQKGYNITYFANSTSILKIIFCSDQIKENANSTIANLKSKGLSKVVMLSGDNSNVAQNVANQTGITEFKANLLPDDKINYLKEYIKNYKTVCMVGDGVNDAAALSMSTVGISMGNIGSDVAIDSSNIVLINDDIKNIDSLVSLSRFVMNIAKQNFIVWGIVNFIGLVLVFGGIFNPATAALYNFLTDFIPLSNSLRAFKWRA